MVAEKGPQNLPGSTWSLRVGDPPQAVRGQTEPSRRCITTEEALQEFRSVAPKDPEEVHSKYSEKESFHESNFDFVPSSTKELTLCEDNMVTRLKAKDLPEPWFSAKKNRVSGGKESQTLPKATNSNDVNTNILPEKTTKRGRPRKNKETTPMKATHKRSKGRSLPASTEDFLLRRSKTPSQDVEELRRKREEDTIACGRSIRRVNSAVQGKNCPPNVTVTSSLLEHSDDPATKVGCPQRSSSRTSSSIRKSSEENNPVEEHAVNHFEECNDNPGPVFVQRPGKEHVHVVVDEEMNRQERLPNSVNRKHVEISSGSETESKGKDRQGLVGMHRRRPSPREDRFDNDCRRRPYQRTLLPRSRSQSHQEDIYDSASRSPPRRFSRANPIADYRSPRRSRSRSPRYRGQEDYHRTGKTLHEYYKVNRFSDRLIHDYRESKGISSNERWHHQQYESPSPDHVPRRRQYDSEDCGRQQRRQSCTPDYWRSPPRSSDKISLGTPTVRPGSKAMKDLDIVRMSPAMERKEQRHKQKIRESEKLVREKKGKKPFYLILDGEGKPYGPGKPAWIAEINKLASGLDPSCTHIRKQTFEVVQTFKERLHEKFDYSAALNDDYLRGLMGKAVTKKRGELISLIKSDGKRPPHFSKEIWERLEKLADSKQREEKSEQGRHANACRITYGRTGSIGMNGIREKLRSQLERSPDPEEIQDEMQQHKGYGGQKWKRASLSMTNEKKPMEVLVPHDDFRSPTLDKCTELQNSEPGHVRPLTTTRQGGSICEEVNLVTRRLDRGHERYTQTESKKTSTEAYIKELEAEIQRLQAQNAMPSTSNLILPSQSAMSARHYSMDRHEVEVNGNSSSED